jgi:predicted nucleic acid-binding protein
VLQELYVNLVRKGIAPADVHAVVAQFANWHVVPSTAGMVLAAIDSSMRWQISLWDALIIQAARSVGATTIWSEDLNDGQDYGGVRVVNPFKLPAP